MKKKVWSVLVALAIGSFGASSVLYALQGGFGAGHGRFDQALYYLGLPWSAQLDRLPLSTWQQSDYLAVVLTPFLINLTLLMVAWVAVVRPRPN